MNDNRIQTDSPHPPLGVVDDLLPDSSYLDRWVIWMQTYAAPEGHKFWRTAVMRECLPHGELDFIAVGEKI